MSSSKSFLIILLSACAGNAQTASTAPRSTITDETPPMVVDGDAEAAVAPEPTAPAEPPVAEDPAASGGEGIGMGTPGTLGHGAGTGTGQGFGAGHGRLGGDSKAKPPQVRMGASTVSGRLPPEVIQRIVRQNFGRFRLCYENGLRANPNLQGRVAVRFVIGRDGAVSSVGNGGSSIPDSSVVSCVVRSFSGLSFPKPEGGIVTVVYPISFAPGG